MFITDGLIVVILCEIMENVCFQRKNIYFFNFWPSFIVSNVNNNSAPHTSQRECMMYSIFVLIMIYIIVREVIDPSKEAYITAFIL